MRNATLLETNVILHSPKRIVHEKLRMPDGKIVDWYYIDSPQSIIVVPITREGRTVMVRQYRHNLKTFTLEFPSGCSSGQESLEEAARRELLEETGFAVSLAKMKNLGTFYVLPSETNRHVTFFLAELAERVSSPKLDRVIEEYFEMDTVEMEFGEAHAQIGRTIQGIETFTALVLASQALRGPRESG